MASNSIKHLRFVLVVLVIVAFQIVVAEPNSRYGIQATSCRLLEYKFVAANPWIAYPIVFEPINRGRLTVWTGLSTLPTSEFECYGQHNSTNEFVLDFANFANKLEWTFYDSNKGATHHGTSVSHNEGVKYKVTLNDKQSSSYLECNTIEKIEQLTGNVDDAIVPYLQTSCQDCSHTLLTMINGQVEELFKTKLNEQILDNLYWHLTQLLSSQHFSGPISFNDDTS